MKKKLKKRKNMKNGRKFILVVAVVIFLCLVAIFALYLLNKPKEPKTVHVQETPVFVRVVKDYVIGIVISNNYSLNFGGVARGAFAEKGVTIVNPFKFSVKVNIDFSGEVKEWIGFSFKEFILTPGETKNFPVTVNIPENASLGNYTGIMKVVMTKF